MRHITFTLLLTILTSITVAHADAPTTAPTTQPAPVVVTVRALIDGRSDLILHGFTAQWHHLDWAAPGVHGGHYEPTYIDGIAWHPNWENSDLNAEVRVPHSMSDTFDGLTPPLPAAPMQVTLEKQKCRGDITIIQQPSAENDFTTIVEFDDNAPPGPDWYEVKLTFVAK